MGVMKNPYIKKTIVISLVASALLAAFSFSAGPVYGAVALVVLAGVNAAYILEAARRYKTINRYSDQLSRVLFSGETLDLNDYSEGELSILNSEIQKLVSRLRDDARLLENDKRFLADSIADISHQLRTPLTSIGIIIDMLGAEELPLKRRLQLVSQFQELLARMVWQIDSLLKISKLDADMITMRDDRILLRELIKKALDPIRISLELKGIDVKVGGENAAFLSADMNWSAEAVENIIKNCMEHCEAGGTIEIDCEENTLYTQLVIRDDGGGIEKEDLPHLFERFYQGKNPSKNSYGIGLALAKMIFSRQNATVKASNRRDAKGAIFTIRFYKGVV